MRRTRRRPLPRHAVTTRARSSSVSCSAWSRPLWLGFLVNWLSAGLALAANVFYVVGYTMMLKRRTRRTSCGAVLAGCFPALIGWTAVTGELAWAPVVLFLVVFFWTPPHFWALATRYREDYAQADVPMLPVSRAGDRGRPPDRSRTRTSMVATSLLLWPRRRDRLVLPGRRHRCSAQRSSSRRTSCLSRADTSNELRCSSRCGCSTGRTPTSRCSSSPPRSIPSCAERVRLLADAPDRAGSAPAARGRRPARAPASRRRLRLTALATGTGTGTALRSACG